MAATKKDYLLVAIIGIAVGLLVQPILSNTLLKYSCPPGAVCSGYATSPIWVFWFARAVVLLFFALLAPIALWVASWIGRRLPVVYQFAKFAAVGSLNSALDLGIFNLQTLIWGGDPRNLSNWLFFIFKSVSFLAATTNSFLWNKFWTFGDTHRSTSTTVLKFYAITIVTYALNVGVATGLKAIGPLGGVPVNVWVNVLAPVLGILTAMFANFLSYKYFVFKADRP